MNQPIDLRIVGMALQSLSFLRRARQDETRAGFNPSDGAFLPYAHQAALEDLARVIHIPVLRDVMLLRATQLTMELAAFNTQATEAGVQPASIFRFYKG